VKQAMRKRISTLFSFYLFNYFFVDLSAEVEGESNVIWLLSSMLIVPFLFSKIANVSKLL
jgi:hypothetical protein